jgi:hypothetical protein
MNDRPAETRVTTFLKATLKNTAVNVPNLEVMAREAGLLGEHQRITNAKPFRRAKSALGIQSVRNGFGPGGGWLWKLPRDRKASTAPRDREASIPSSRQAPAASSIRRQPVRTERCVPLDWVDGVDRLQYHRPMRGVPHHRWRQFVDDCNKRRYLGRGDQ